MRWGTLSSVVFIAACQAATFEIEVIAPPTPFVPAISSTPIADATIPPTPPEPVPVNTTITVGVTLGTCVAVPGTLVGSSGTFRVTAPGFPAVVGRRVLLHQAQHEDPAIAGSFEVRMLGATGSSSGNLVLLFTEELSRTYESDEASARAQACTVETFDSLVIADTSKVSGPTWNGSAGGVLAIRANSISHAGNLDMNGRGFRGGATSESDAVDFNGMTTIDDAEAGEKGEGTDASLAGLRGRGSARNGGGGGNAGIGFQGGGGGGAGVGKGGDAGGNPTNMKLGIGGTYGLGVAPFGGGGGGGYAIAGTDAGAGGAGGGFIYVEVTGTFQSNAGSILRASGQNGVASSGNGSGGGGGGGGGVIDIRADTCAGTFTTQANGGSGGGGSGSPTYGGGGGGGGRILRDCTRGGTFSDQVLGGNAGDAEPDGNPGEPGAAPTPMD